MMYTRSQSYTNMVANENDTPSIKHQDCNRSPTTPTIYLIKVAGGAHLKSKIEKFPWKQHHLKNIGINYPQHLPPKKKLSTQNLKIHTQITPRKHI